MHAKEVVEQFLTFWGAQDVDSAMSMISEDCVYSLKISETALPFAGDRTGRESIREAFFAILADWDYLEFKPGNLIVDGNEVRTQIEHVYRYRRTGDILSGTFRGIANVENELITRIQEFHDAARVEAFVRMVSVKPPEPSPFTGRSAPPAIQPQKTPIKQKLPCSEEPCGDRDK